MKTCDVTRRVSAPGGASPRGHLSAVTPAEWAAGATSFRHHAAAVLARRNRRDLDAARQIPVLDPRSTQLVKVVQRRQGVQLAIFAGEILNPNQGGAR